MYQSRVHFELSDYFFIVRILYGSFEEYPKNPIRSMNNSFIGQSLSMLLFLPDTLIFSIESPEFGIWNHPCL